MVRKSEEKQVVTKPAPFNGVGEITVRSLLNGPEEMSQKGRVFGHTTVYPGAAIGYHVHHGDSETYYILSGTGRYNDNGTMDDRKEDSLKRSGETVRLADNQSFAALRDGGRARPILI